MAINLISQTTFTTGVLIGDTGTNGATPSPTEVGNVPISAALEVQSKLGGFVIPRMTTVQRLAIVTPVNGMQVYDSTLNAFFFYINGGWTQGPSTVSDVYASGSLTAADVNGMNAAPVQLIPAVASSSIIVKGFVLQLLYNAVFTGGGAIQIQFTNTASAGGLAVASTIPATFLTNANNKEIFVAGAFATAAPTSYLNQGIFITNATAPFAAGGTSTVNWQMWYSVIRAQ